MRVLFALDDSQSGRLAAGFLAALKPPDHLQLLHVADVGRYQHPTMPPKIPKDYYGRLEESLVKAGQDFLDEMGEALPADFKSVETSVQVGEPVRMILRAVRRLDPDLLVLGSRGVNFLQDWFVGSISYSVASQANCPMLIVKRPVKHIRKVLLAYDGSDEADRAAAFLGRGLFRDKVELLIATAWLEQPPVPPRLEADVQALTKAAKLAAAELAEKIRTQLPADRFATTIEVLEGKPGQVLVDLAAERGMDLVVMGARKLAKIKRLFLGSVSHTVLHKAPCSVLVVRGKD